jgi:hypothetical protein
MKRVVTTLEQLAGSERGAMQAPSTTVLGEEVSGAACTHLATASKLLRERGYGMLCRFGHIHATREAQEWHVCILADLVSMPPSRLLACPDEALALRVEQSIALSPQT